jgi:uncharacterized membrane protein (UPF0127 family)
LADKIPKILAGYVATNIPSLIWIYKCASCRFFQMPNLCQIVSEQGPPDPGIINPESWCALWAPRNDDPPLAWLARTRDPWLPKTFSVNGRIFPITYVATKQPDLATGLGGKAVTDMTTMLFMFPQRGYWQFWIGSVTSPLDIIWIDVDGRVVHIVKNAPTSSATVYRPAAPAIYVIEAKAGFADANAVMLGSIMQLRFG